jgi:hypothetical protein
MKAIRLPVDDDDVLIDMQALADSQGVTVQAIRNRLCAGRPVPPMVTIGRRKYVRSSDARSWALHGDAAIAAMTPIRQEVMT